MVKQIADLLCGHPALLDQVENDARVQVAATAAHRKAIECGKPHGRCHALALIHRAHAGAATEMGDDDAAIGRERAEYIWKDAGDVFIGQPVKSIPPDTL